MDQDHRLLIRSAAPLLKSRNAGVVLAVVELYDTLAPASEFGTVARPLLNLLKGSTDIQYIVLAAVVTLARQRPSTFGPHIKTFFGACPRCARWQRCCPCCKWSTSQHGRILGPPGLQRSLLPLYFCAVRSV